MELLSKFYENGSNFLRLGLHILLFIFKCRAVFDFLKVDLKLMVISIQITHTETELYSLFTAKNKLP
jgi:hypothetical protein